MPPNASSHIIRRCNNSGLEVLSINVMSIVGESSAGCVVIRSMRSTRNERLKRLTRQTASTTQDWSKRPRFQTDPTFKTMNFARTRLDHYTTSLNSTCRENMCIRHSATMITFWLAKEVLGPLKQTTKNILVQTHPRQGPISVSS